MSEFIEFQGKNIDSAIEEACDYFNTEREKLEIEILEDSKSGVFGIIGARKAKIQARKIDLSTVKNESVFTRSEIIPRENTKPAMAAPKQKPAKLEDSPKKLEKPQEKVQEKKAEASESIEMPAAQENNTVAKNEAREENINQTKEFLDANFTSLEELDHDELKAIVIEVVENIVKYVDPDITTEAEIQDERLCVTIQSEESGLLIGKEGQTLQALEYLSARIIAKKIGAHVRIQIEIGDYRSRQDQRLHDFALTLAQRVLETGKPASTKPLSSYQRRIVHVALQDMTEVHTRSIGEGTTKRVIVSKAKNDRY